MSRGFSVINIVWMSPVGIPFVQCQDLIQQSQKKSTMSGIKTNRTNKQKYFGNFILLIKERSQDIPKIIFARMYSSCSVEGIHTVFSSSCSTSQTIKDKSSRVMTFIQNRKILITVVYPYIINVKLLSPVCVIFIKLLADLTLDTVCLCGWAYKNRYNGFICSLINIEFLCQVFYYY